MLEQIAYIGLGSNLDDPLKQLQNALAEMAVTTGIDLCKRSSFYVTKPVGPQDQPDYVNAVVKIKTQLSPLALLDELQRIEKRQGRVRNVRWGARTLDLDILLYAENVIDHPRLTVPHPEIQNRAFVLCPLAEITPQIEIPGFGPILELLAQVDQSGIRKQGTSE